MTDALRDAAKQFCDTLNREIECWACELVETQTVNVRDVLGKELEP
jgi:hypothetical protein